MSPEKWIELLKLYGPMALFVFMVFVLLVKARAKAGQSDEERRVQLLAYGFVWISIFILAAIIVIVFWKVNFPGEYVVIGKITNLTYPQVVVTEEELFLHKRTVAGLDFEYDWRLISKQRFIGTVELLLQQRPSDSKVLKYKMPIHKEFYDGPVEMEYEPNNDQMILTYGANRVVITPSPASIAETHSLRLANPEVVYASSLPTASPQELIRALDADDPLIRRNARLDLAKLGSTAVPYLSQVLTNPNSSYRLRLGVMVTLSDIGAPSNQGLSEAARCSILKASIDSDPTLQEEAKAALASGIARPGNCPASSPITPKQGRTENAGLFAPATFRKRDWHPIDLASATTAGIFALDGEGKVNSITTSEHGVESQALFSISTQNDFSAVAANSKYVFVAANSPPGCLVYRYSLETKVVDQKFVGLTKCTGIATNGDALYVVLPGYNVIRYWRDWNVKKPQNISIAEDEKTSSLCFDSSGNQLLMTDGLGRVYYFPLSPGGDGTIPHGKLLISTKGNGTAIVADREHIFLSSQAKVIVLNKSAIKNEQAPIKLSRIDTVNGLAIDTDLRLWIADSVQGIVEVYPPPN
jgi:hypothetical protein